MDKELTELRNDKILFQKRETRASNELNSIITQRDEEMTQVNSRLPGLPDKLLDAKRSEARFCYIRTVF